MSALQPACRVRQLESEAQALRAQVAALSARIVEQDAAGGLQLQELELLRSELAALRAARSADVEEMEELHRRA